MTDHARFETRCRGVASVPRLRDYIGFAVWFAGLSYMAIWLLAWGTLGRALPPSLHILGALMFLAVAGQGMYLVLRRARRRRASSAPPMAQVAEDAGALSRKLLLDGLPRVKPRNHFGLRGAPR